MNIIRRRRDYIGGAKSASCDYSQQYLTIVSLENENTISWKTSDAGFVKTISVSTDGGNTWESKTPTTNSTSLAVLNAGGKLLIKGVNSNYANSTNYTCFVAVGSFNVEGNIMSLIYGDSFVSETTMSAERTFNRIFSESKIVDASNLILPATTLTSNCYDQMFNSCTYLITAPDLIAETMVSGCYYRMFYQCSSLRFVKCLATSVVGTSQTINWLEGTPAGGTFVKSNNVSISWWQQYNVPSSWTIIDV